MNTSKYSLNSFDAKLLTLPQSYVATIISVFELAPPLPSRAQQNSISAVLNKCRSVFFVSFSSHAQQHSLQR